MKERQHAISGAFVFLLLGVFAVFSTLLVLFGAQGYRAVVDRSEMHNDRRMLSAYVRNALRSEDTEGALDIIDNDSQDILAISMLLDGSQYVKYIYADDGFLKELFVEAEREFDAEEGQIVCPAQSMTASLSGELLTVEVTDLGGTVYATDIALKCAS